MMDNATHALLGACGGIVVGDIAGASVWSMALCGLWAGKCLFGHHFEPWQRHLLYAAPSRGEPWGVYAAYRGLIFCGHSVVFL